MKDKKKSKVEDFKPLTAELHNGSYTVCITGTDEYSPIIVQASDKSFTIPFSRFRDYFMEDDPEVLIDRMSVFEKMTYEEFQDYFESHEEQAAPIVAVNLCPPHHNFNFRDGVPVIVHTMARTAYCRNRHERLVAMFYDLVCELGMPVECISGEGFNNRVYEALAVYETAYSAKEEIERIRIIVSSGNELAITVKRYDLEYLIKRAAESKSWNRRKILQGYLDLLNTLCNDQRSSQ